MKTKTTAVAKRGEVVRLPAPAAPKTMLQIIAEATMDPRCDVAKMRELLEMQRTLQADEARRSFTRDFNGLQHELPSIRRDGRISHAVGDSGMTRSGKKAMTTRYATYPNIMSVIGPLLKKYGFTLSNVVEPSRDGSGSEVVGYLDHIEGHSRITRFPLRPDRSGQKNEQQGLGSGQQYAMRYNAIALLNIVSMAPEDDDRDGFPPADAKPATKKTEPVSDFPGDRPMKDDPISSGPKRISKAQFEKLAEAIVDCGVGNKAVLDKYRIKKLTDLPEELFKSALDACANYKKAKAAAAKAREESDNAEGT